jgi:uncharacterized membrane-anchored protein YitT (DUF2179 family)
MKFNWKKAAGSFKTYFRKSRCQPVDGDRKTLIQSLLKEYFMIICAGVLYAIAFKYFVLPSKVILTGTEGIAAALSYYFESYGLFIVLYSIFQCLLLGFAFLRVSRTFALRSLVLIVIVVVVLASFPELEFAQPESHNERIILVIFGGLLAGVAKALAFRNRGSTGDEDLLGAYFASKYLKPVGYVTIAAAIVSTTFGLLLDLAKNGSFESVINTLMYTSVYIFASAETLNNFYRKFKLTMLTIITRLPDPIGKAITATSSYRTYTIQQGVGGYTGESFCMVRTIITHEELPQMIEAVKQVDKNCFYYHHNIGGVSGQYYIAPIR